MGKIYPNDPCPCGSGKKYKYCCGSNKNIVNDDHSENNSLNKFSPRFGQPLEDCPRSEIQLEDFIKENIYEDIHFLNTALATILGPVGYDFCSRNRKDLKFLFDQDGFMLAAQYDIAGIYELAESTFSDSMFANQQPYSGGSPEANDDILSLYEKGFLYEGGLQVEIFHAYVTYNLKKRFNDYFYVPGKEWLKGQGYGVFAHRGYDFLVAMSLYLELQLGVHVYYDSHWPGEYNKTEAKATADFFKINEQEVNKSLLIFLQPYRNVLTEISEYYRPYAEFDFYVKLGAFSQTEFQTRLGIFDVSEMEEQSFHAYEGPVAEIKDRGEAWGYNFIEYIKCLIPAICLQDGDLWWQAQLTYEACDFIKYRNGLELISRLFNDKDTSWLIGYKKYDSPRTKKQMKEHGLSTDPDDIKRMEAYYDAVFYMADELNGFATSQRLSNWTYDDFPDISDDELAVRGFWKMATPVNPARKSTRRGESKKRKLRLELYQLFNGMTFRLFEDDQPGKVESMNTYGYGKQNMVGKYPILPWLSSGSEETVHVMHETDKNKELSDLYSHDINLRQQFLRMELELKEFPVNCIEEFLNPGVFYTWTKQQELLKAVEEKNDKLEELNERLNKQININQELVKNLTDSSANYLNPDRLEETGVTLRNADREHPEVGELHTEGHTLLMQSEQETFMTRQLNSLVWRCNADLNFLTNQIREGIEKNDGLPVTDPVGFALKSLLTRVFFREHDIRSNFICEKMKKTKEELQSVKDSFIQDILSNDISQGEMVFDWWNRHIGVLNVNVSSFWGKICIVPDKAFYDLVVEIITEQVLNALSHGDLSKGITIDFDYEEKLGKPPRWAYILCENKIGERFCGGGGVGNKSLGETLFMLNGEEKGLDTDLKGETFYSKAWLAAFLLKPIHK